MFEIIYAPAERVLNNKNAATRGVRQRLTSKEFLIEDSSRLNLLKTVIG